jgi:hypothetical protein
MDTDSTPPQTLLYLQQQLSLLTLLKDFSNSYRTNLILNARSPSHLLKACHTLTRLHSNPELHPKFTSENSGVYK